MKNKKFKIPEKFKDVQSFSFTTFGNELMVVFHGFEQEKDLAEFADFLFGKIKMNYKNIAHNFFLSLSKFKYKLLLHD